MKTRTGPKGTRREYKMRLKAILELEYDSEEDARAVADALVPDDQDFVETEIEGSMLRAEASSTSADGLRHTLEDYLACVRVAEEAVGVGGSKKGGRG